MSNATNTTAGEATIDEEESLLIGKIEALLKKPPQAANDDDDAPLFSMAERTLVALVLLSRVTQDAAYVNIWHAHGKELVAF